MTDKKKNNRRTKLQIKEDEAMEFFKSVGIDAESEEGQKYLKKIREKFEKKTRDKVSPELSAAKSARLRIKRDIEKMNRQVNAILDTEKGLTEERINTVLKAFKEADALVVEKGGETIRVRDGGLKVYLDKKFPAQKTESTPSL